jgi:hypothetical protein
MKGLNIFNFLMDFLIFLKKNYVMIFHMIFYIFFLFLKKHYAMIFYSFLYFLIFIFRKLFFLYSLAGIKMLFSSVIGSINDFFFYFVCYMPSFFYHIFSSKELIIIVFSVLFFVYFSYGVFFFLGKFNLHSDIFFIVYTIILFFLLMYYASIVNPHFWVIPKYIATPLDVLVTEVALKRSLYYNVVASHEAVIMKMLVMHRH